MYIFSLNLDAPQDLVANQQQSLDSKFWADSQASPPWQCDIDLFCACRHV